MCGIIGAFGNDVSKITEIKIKKALSKIKHRGPDAQNFIRNDNLFLGHTRLSIIDTRDIANQPMYDESNKIIIVYNGEIYNHKEIREELINKNYEFRTNSDTEVILNAYKEYGEDCVKKFIGMWAFCIYDSIKKIIFMSRDRIGEKPLYYYTSKGNLYFASELPPLLELLDTKKNLNYKALCYYFTYNIRHIPWDLSIFEDIHKLPPSHNLIFDGKNIKIKRYWKPDFSKSRKTKSYYFQKYEEILTKAANRTTVSDVPVGIMLSGGVDSTSIAMLLKNKKIISYTIGYNKNDEEFIRASKVAKKIGIKNKRIIFSGEKIIKEGPKYMRKLIANLGEPINLLQPLYTYLIMKEVKKDGIKVIIGGNGADEIFYGYDGSNKSLILTYLFLINDTLPIMKFMKLSRIFKNNKLIKMLELENNQRKPYLYNYYSEDTLKLFNKLYLDKTKNINLSKLPSEINKLCNSKYFIENSQWLGLVFENEHSITITSDLGGMADAIEIRTPFLDKDLIEFGFKLPLKYKVHNIFSTSGNKWIMRKFIEKKLGKEFLYRKKMGFGYNINYAEIIRKHWKSDIKRVLFEYLPKTNIFNMKYISKIYKEHMVGKDNSKILFGLYVFGIWHQQFNNFIEEK